MREHVKFLDTYYASGNFVISGRKLPRTGGIILATGTTKKAIEKIMKLDPFYVRGLATFSIIEFNASQKATHIDELIKK